MINVKNITPKQFKHLKLMFEIHAEYMGSLCNQENMSKEDLEHIIAGVRRARLLMDIALALPESILSEEKAVQGWTSTQKCLAQTMWYIASQYKLNSKYMDEMFEGLEDFLDEN
ncbi:hypothetical protein UFOVP9_26 [uncultured Caudovirales phage]|jgi:hypothetical protein|uniref:Uncharacterized protein n=1 Tax=uncultured Caudovirales phage TaxID=2100421 RepID=A0A6J5KLK3_9CAUD|nr:hypothetical protein UFOVP9_26 [uncultured Caudovirales phage]